MLLGCQSWLRQLVQNVVRPAEKLQLKYHIYTLNLFYDITPYKFCKPKLVSAIFVCHKIKYVNLGILIWLFYFDLVDSLLQFIERNSDHSVLKECF